MVYRVNANPKRIKWARKDAGFELEDLPKYHSNIDYRLKNKRVKFSTELKLEIREVKYRRNIFLDLSQDLERYVPDFSQSFFKEKDISKLAKEINDYISIPLKTREEWLFNPKKRKIYSHSRFLHEWKEVVSDFGILVFETEKVKTEEMSGMSFYFNKSPIILLNGHDTFDKRIFTLFVMLVHLVRGETVISDVKKNNEEEIFYNKVASEVLAPQSSLYPRKAFDKGRLNLGVLPHLYGVSKQVIVFQSYFKGLISKEEKDALIKEIDEYNLKNRKKILTPSGKLQKSSLPLFMRKRKHEGLPFTRLVLKAYQDHIITNFEASKYLNISIDEVEDLREEIL